MSSKKLKRKMIKAKRLCQQLIGGAEKPSSKPMQIPIGFKKPTNMKAKIHEMIKNERLMYELDNAGLETFEDSEDFDIGDDYDPTSPYEHDFDQGIEYPGDNNGMQEEQPINNSPKPKNGEAVEGSNEPVEAPKKNEAPTKEYVKINGEMYEKC
jgi:hypothetical protein